MLTKDLEDLTGEGIIWGGLGSSYRESEQYDAALVAYRQAINVLERIRVIAGSEQGRTSFIAQLDYVYSYASSLYHQQGQDEEVFYTSERGRLPTRPHSNIQNW